MKEYQKFGIVMGANFEAVAFAMAAYYSAIWLDEHYPKSFHWSTVTYVLALILIARSWYVMLRVLIRDQKAAATGPEPKSETTHDDRTK